MAVPGYEHATPEFRTACGPNALASLPRQLDRAGVKRAVVFCGPSLVKRHGAALGSLDEVLGGRLVARFDGVRPQSPLTAVEAGRDVLAETGADAVIAVGGGSAIVTARAATILLAEKKDIRELSTKRGADGRLISPKLLAPKLPQWIVPTTPTTAYAKAGSAVRDPDTGDRLALFDPKTRAQGVFLDPSFAMTAPIDLVQGAALNAFSMSVEGLQARSDDPLAEALLTHAMVLLASLIPRLAATPDDPEPRLRLMLAALLSGQGSNYVGGGLAQALSHAVGPRSSTSNGVVEALLLPHTMRFNAQVSSASQRAVARALIAQRDEQSPPATDGISAVQDVLSASAVPLRLRDVGVTHAALSESVLHALDDWSITQLPRPVTGEDLEALLQAAW